MLQPTHPSPFLQQIDELIQDQLAPLTRAIDQEGLYPREFLHTLGTLGGYGAFLPSEEGGQDSLAKQWAVIKQVATECGSTSFLVWCQSTCAWYLHHSPNRVARERYLPRVASGKLLAGTGMSNTVKHLAGIEKIHLRAKRDGDGYVVRGSLPWVSNVGEDHLAIVAASVEDGAYIMFVVPPGTAGFQLRPCLEFTGLEGTRTLGLRFDSVRISDEDVLAQPEQFAEYVRRFTPGFVIGQTGMGLGIVEASLQVMRESNASTAHVNVFLDDQEKDLAKDLQRLEAQAAELAEAALTDFSPILPVLKLRAAVSELTLKAANSAILHAGAKGYLLIHPAQRRLREAVFVAIVTPALKHLRKEIARLEALAESEQNKTAETA